MDVFFRHVRIIFPVPLQYLLFYRRSICFDIPFSVQLFQSPGKIHDLLKFAHRRSVPFLRKLFFRLRSRCLFRRLLFDPQAFLMLLIKRLVCFCVSDHRFLIRFLDPRQDLLLILFVPDLNDQFLAVIKNNQYDGNVFPAHSRGFSSARPENILILKKKRPRCSHQSIAASKACNSIKFYLVFKPAFHIFSYSCKIKFYPPPVFVIFPRSMP